MPKKKKQKKSKKTLLVIDIILVILILVAGCIIYLLASAESKTVDTPTTQYSEVPQTPTTETEEDNQSKEDEIYENHQNEGEDPNSLEGVTGTITSMIKTSSALRIRVNIDQFISTGTCKLTMSSNGQYYEDTAEVVVSASTSSCSGFDVPLSALTSGSWQVVIDIVSSEKRGVIMGEVEI